MIDIHTHLLPAVDDGSQSFEESLELLRNAFNDGITDIILTSHYDTDSYYHKEKEELMPLINELKEKAKDIGINLYSGNELYANRDIVNDLKTDKCFTLANSKYILIEFPFTYYEEIYDDILYDLKKEGYKIIIAHPERYSYVKEDVEFCLRWLNEGYELQCNSTSLKHHQKTMDKLLNRRWVKYMASDGHNVRRPVLLKDAYNYIVSKYDKDYADELFYKNAKLIIDGGMW